MTFRRFLVRALTLPPSSLTAAPLTAALLTAALLTAAQPAQADELALPGAATGACVTSAQTVAIGRAWIQVRCTFTFVDPNGQPVVGQPFSATVSGETRSPERAPATLVTDRNGQVSAGYEFSRCPSAGSGFATVIGSAAGTSAQATVLAQCDPVPLQVAQIGCQDTGQPAPDLGAGPGTVVSCAFRTAAAGAFGVSFALSRADSNKSAFIVDQASVSDRAGNFVATVWTYGTGVSVTGAVDSTVDFRGASALAGYAKV